MKKLKIGIAGLGRLGKEHAENLKYRIKAAELVALCSMNKDELIQGEQNLEIKTVFDNFEDFLKHPEMEAVCIVTSSNTHADFIIQALEYDKHVFCEKPLALSLEDCHRVRKFAQKKPHLKVAIGFNRRFDASYYQAWKKIHNGEIGKPFMVYNQTVDMDNTAAFQVQFSKTGGGFLVDANIHDMDLVHWLLGSRIHEVTVAGGAYAYPDFAQYQDVDNVFVLAKTEDGGAAVINGSRTAFHGHATWGFVRGTQGELVIGRNPNQDRLEILDKYGVRFECVQTFFERFRESFLNELEDFIDCVQKDRELRVNLQDAIDATQVAFACREAYISGKTIKIEFDT